MATTKKPVKFIVSYDHAPPMPPPPSFNIYNGPVEATMPVSDPSVFNRLEVTQYVCNADGDWGLYDCRDVKDPYLEYIAQRVDAFSKYHKPVKKKDHQQILFVVRRIVFSKDTGFEDFLLTHKYVDLRGIEEEKKVYVNGPKKDQEFLKKVGKHYG